MEALNCLLVIQCSVSKFQLTFLVIRMLIFLLSVNIHQAISSLFSKVIPYCIGFSSYIYTIGLGNSGKPFNQSDAKPTQLPVVQLDFPDPLEALRMHVFFVVRHSESAQFSLNPFIVIVAEDGDRLLEGYLYKLGGTLMSNWPRKYFHLFPNRLEWRGEQAGVSESIFCNLIHQEM